MSTPLRSAQLDDDWTEVSRETIPTGEKPEEKSSRPASPNFNGRVVSSADSVSDTPRRADQLQALAGALTQENKALKAPTTKEAEEKQALRTQLDALTKREETVTAQLAEAIRVKEVYQRELSVLADKTRQLEAELEQFRKGSLVVTVVKRWNRGLCIGDDGGLHFRPLW